MRAPPSDRNLLDWRAAIPAWLPFAVIDHQVVLMMTLLALAVLIITERRPTILITSRNHVIDGFIQLLTFCGSQTQGRP